MTQYETLSSYLEPLDLSAWQYHPTVGSTNDIALAWARKGAPDWALVVADAQTAGRGRDRRRWVTKPGCSLAVSLVLRLETDEKIYFSRLTALGALGLIQALAGLGLAAELKWPNDILLAGKKVAGVLVEADWHADQVEAVVIGMGVNITSKSVPPSEALRYPATAVEAILGSSVDRWALLAETLRAIQDYRAILATDAFIETWNQRLAFRNTWVRFQIPGQEPHIVKVLGVTPDGQLGLEYEDGRQVNAPAGEILVADGQG